MLRQIAWRGTFKSLLDLVVGKFNKCVVLLGQLGGEHVVVLLAYLALALLHHALADEPHLAEGEQGLVTAHGRQQALRGRRAAGGAQGRRVPARAAGPALSLEAELLAPLQPPHLLPDVGRNLL